MQRANTIAYGERAPRKQHKMYIPQAQYPGFNFVGLIIGSRGAMQKSIEQESGARIAVRGRGSSKQRRRSGGGNGGGGGGGRLESGDDDDDDLHVLITADRDASIQRAVELLEQLMSPESLGAAGAQRDPSVPSQPMRTAEVEPTFTYDLLYDDARRSAEPAAETMAQRVANARRSPSSSTSPRKSNDSLRSTSSGSSGKSPRNQNTAQRRSAHAAISSNSNTADKSDSNGKRG